MRLPQIADWWGDRSQNTGDQFVMCDFEAWPSDANELTIRLNFWFSRNAWLVA
jgi:hypothetical protein